MAAARELPHIDQAVRITISPSGTISNTQGYLSVADATPIEFDNTGTSEVVIEFNASAFPSINDPGGTITSPISASAMAVSYVIKNPAGRILGGPYAIQWGNGVLQIAVSANSAAFSIAVTVGGKLQFTTDAKYSVSWSGNGLWSPQPGSISPTPPGQPNPNPVQQARPGVNGPVTCSFGPGNVPQGGTVHVGS